MTPAALTAVVLGLRAWIGDWIAVDGALERVGWLVAAVGAGAVAYGIALVAGGLKPRNL